MQAARASRKSGPERLTGSVPRPPGGSTAALAKRLIKGQLSIAARPYTQDSGRVGAKRGEHGQGKPDL
jgi:hypothetical protein